RSGGRTPYCSTSRPSRIVRCRRGSNGRRGPWENTGRGTCSGRMLPRRRAFVENPMKITDIRATSVTVPLEAPLRHANGCHWGRVVRAVIEGETDEGLVGLGEL